jgi:predicted DNA-binding transcriptional regulator AlpA
VSEVQDTQPINRADHRAKAAKDRGKANPHGGEISTLASIQLVWEPHLCVALGRSRYTIRRWIERGILPPPIRMTEQGLAWRLRDIEAALDRLARKRTRVNHRGAVKEQMQKRTRHEDRVCLALATSAFLSMGGEHENSSFRGRRLLGSSYPSESCLCGVLRIQPPQH